jgi:hypothetical protein
MRKLTVIFTLLTMVVIVMVTTQCSNHGAGKTAFTDTVITPVDLPIVVPGFKFPEDTSTIYSWISPKYDSTRVFNHAWGLWAGLTAQSGETFQGDSLLVYQTWLGIGDLQTIINKGLGLQGIKTKTSRTILSFPKQVKDANEAAAKLQKLGLIKGAIDTLGTPAWTAVSYNPASAAHVIKYQLLKKSVLNSYLVKNRIGSIPAFPINGINIKPVYFIGHKHDTLMRVDVWPGPPNPPSGYAPDAWHTYVYADPKNSQKPGKSLVPVTTQNPNAKQIADATCNLNDFINFKLDTGMAAYINKQQGPVQRVAAQTGDIAILVAMHATTREIHNWTWQSYYWVPDPDNPVDPSSKLAASLRPSQLKGAAAHYAAVTTYAEVLPLQPINGGTNTGVTPVIGYNPYLEAVFVPSTFGIPNALNAGYQYGVQTNCMSCHAMATIDPNAPYSTDQYISMNNPIFINTVQLDFAWSIKLAIIREPPAAKK